MDKGIKKLMDERNNIIERVLDLIIEEMTQEDKGNLTTQYVIRILEDAIGTMKSHALRRPAKDYK